LDPQSTLDCCRWSGRIISESALSSRITAVRQAIGDSGEQQRLIRTVPRKGFRFVGEIQEQQPSEDASANSSLRTTQNATPQLMLPDKPSIAVLPFQNMSGDPEQEHFADGTVEEIITALSRFSRLFVIARNSSFKWT
jgi:hypothetical protein